MACLHAPSRRELLLASGTLFAWTYLPKIARAEGRDPRFLTIILRGALDGLGAVAPVGDPDWIALRSDKALKLAVTNLASAIEDSGAKVTSDSLPAVSADETQLVQLFQNLIGNAIKYRRAGVKPRVSISAERKGAMWEFAIADNGIGIAADSHEYIFGVFHRLHGRKEYDGTGIGLTICRKAVHRHGGDIRVVSTPGEGSMFCFTFPAAD